MSRLSVIEAELAILKPKVIALEAEAKAIRDAEAAAVEAARRLAAEEKHKKDTEARLAAWYATEDGKTYLKNEEMYAARRKKLEDANTSGKSLAEKMLLHSDDMLIVSTIVSILEDVEFKAIGREYVKSKLTLAFQKKRFNYLYGSVASKAKKMFIERGLQESYGDYEEYLEEFDYDEYIPIKNVSKGVIDWCIESHSGEYMGDRYASSYAYEDTIDWADEITVLNAIIKAGAAKNGKATKVYEEYVRPPYGARITAHSIKALIECPWEFELDAEDEYEDVEDSSSESGSESGSESDYDDDDDKPFTFTLYVKFSFPKQEAPKATPPASKKEAVKQAVIDASKEATPASKKPPSIKEKVEAARAKKAAEAAKPTSPAPAPAPASEKPASQVPNMDDKYLLRPEQFTVGAEFHASNKQTYVVSDKKQKLPRKPGDVLFMKKKGGRNNIRFEVAQDYRVIQSEKSDYAFTEESYEAESGTGMEKFYKPDGTKMTFKEAKAMVGGTHKSGESFSHRQDKNISLGYLKKTSEAAPAINTTASKEEVKAAQSLPTLDERIAALRKLVFGNKDEPKAEAPTTIPKPIEKYTNYEIADMIKERLKKHGKTAALSSLNKAQLLQLYKEVMTKYS